MKIFRCPECKKKITKLYVIAYGRHCLETGKDDLDSRTTDRNYVCPECSIQLDPETLKAVE